MCMALDPFTPEFSSRCFLPMLRVQPHPREPWPCAWARYPKFVQKMVVVGVLEHHGVGPHGDGPPKDPARYGRFVLPSLPKPGH